MKIKITIEGSEYNWLERSYIGDYHKLHASNWNDRMRDMLDALQDSEPVDVEVKDEM